MNFTYVDADKLDEISRDIIQLVSEYDIEITNLFKRFSNVPYETKEWVGQAAEYYFKLISLDKAQFTSFGESIKTFAYKIKADSNQIRQNVDKCVESESVEGLL